MNKLDRNPAEPGLSPTAKSKDNKKASYAVVTTPPQPTKNQLKAAVPNLTAVKTLEKVEHEHELLQTLIDTIPVMVIVCDPNKKKPKRI